MKLHHRFFSDDHHHEVQKYAELIKDFNFDEFFKSAFEPKISEDADKGGKKIDLSLDMTGFRPDQIQIHLKDHDLIVQVEQNKIKENQIDSFSFLFKAESSSSDKQHTARSFIYKAITLPPVRNVFHFVFFEFFKFENEIFRF